MKRFKINYFVLIFTFVSVLNADNIDGFRDLKWGDSITKLLSKQLIERRGFSNYYKKHNENYIIGTSKVDDIKYQFFNDRFSGVSINYTAREVYEDLKYSISLKYGYILNCESRYDYVNCHGFDKHKNYISLDYYVGDPGRGTLKLQSHKLNTEEMELLDKTAKDSLKGL